ncbi:unnamed protein product [Soboliphyme baturini]|uniref:Uncharacterized protein n=1 Tax=Soboliphyme baturini TaxID=241478 RepID=A0A183IE34_9BILA|nr:unnamed protein product [Soboliphyme baturini]
MNASLAGSEKRVQATVGVSICCRKDITRPTNRPANRPTDQPTDRRLPALVVADGRGLVGGGGLLPSLVQGTPRPFVLRLPLGPSPDGYPHCVVSSLASPFNKRVGRRRRGGNDELDNYNDEDEEEDEGDDECEINSRASTT